MHDTGIPYDDEMRQNRQLAILLLFLHISSSLLAAGTRDPVEEEEEEQPLLVDSNDCYSTGNTNCYLYRVDTRKCMSPICGGFWIRLYNNKGSGQGELEQTTECADGTFAQECYVSGFNKSCIPQELQNSFLETATYVCGSYVHGFYDEYFPDYRDLLIKQPEYLVDNDQQNAITCYQARHDTRRCPSPMCGGYWLSNSSGDGSTIACPDGSLMNECYVAALDYSHRPFVEEESTTLGNSKSTFKSTELTTSEDATIVCGSFIDGKYQGFTGFYDFLVLG